MNTNASPDKNGINITIDDLRTFNFEEILLRPLDHPFFEGQKSHTCFNYARQFLAEAEAAAKEGDITRQVICGLFCWLCSPQFQFDYDINRGYDAPSLPRLTESYYEPLLIIVTKLEDPELQARVADILWELREGDYQIAELAVDAYLSSARRLEDPVNPFDGVRCIERALQIAAQLNRKGEKYKKTISHIEEVLQRFNGEDPKWFSCRLMNFLLEKKEGEPSVYIPLTQKLAEAAESKCNWELARDYWDIQAQWYERQQNKEGIYNAKRRAAETYVSHAKEYNNVDNVMGATAKLSSAIEALRRIRAPKEDIDRVHALKLKYQARNDDFKEYSSSINISDIVGSARNAVKGKSLRECVLIIAANIQSPLTDMLRESTTNLIERYPFQPLIQKQLLDEKGRVIAKHPTIEFGNEDSREQYIRECMYEQAILHQSVTAQGIIIPALFQIALEHHIRQDDLREFVVNNPFVPPQHEGIFLRGLYLGFKFDFMLAIHLLIPQIENSIRYLLEQRGVITSYLDAQGIQEEYPLGKLLYMEAVKDIFDKDILFDLQGLLVERFGSNLRNWLAHGRLNDLEANSLRAVYAWGLILRLCCTPTLIQETTTEKTKTQSNTQNSEIGGA